jgi:hypothetical protein
LPGSFDTIETSVTKGFWSASSLTDIVAVIGTILWFGGHKMLGETATDNRGAEQKFSKLIGAEKATSPPPFNETVQCEFT